MLSLSVEVISMLNKRQDAAFEVVFNLYYPRLVSFAKEYVYYEDAKNLVQDAFITLLEKRPVIPDEYHLQSYLYTTVKNNCLMRLRHEKIQKGFFQEAEMRLQNQTYISALEQLDTSSVIFKEMEAIIEKTLNELPPRCREVFILSRKGGRKNHEIAEELNITTKAVEAHITKALKELKIALKDYIPLVAFFLLLND